MIITLTLNPAVDQTLWIEELTPGQVHRVDETHLDPAGKGVNASRIAARLGCATIAFGLVAGDTGDMIEKALAAERVQHHFVRIPGETRINFTVVERSGRRASSFYAPGPDVPAEALRTLDEMLGYWMRAGRVLVLAGSIPPNVSSSIYAEYIRAGRDAGIQVFLDASGDALREGIEAGPHLIKPNVAEAEELLGRSLPGEREVIEAARELSDRAERVVISMGAQGAVCARKGEIWRVHTPKVERRSTVGSGDSMVAGMAVALSRGEELEAALALGTAAGAATAMSKGTGLGQPKDVHALLPKVRIERL